MFSDSKKTEEKNVCSSEIAAKTLDHFVALISKTSIKSRLETISGDASDEN